VKTVTDNKWGKIPGIDGIVWTSAADKMNAALRLAEKGCQS
jgi:RNA-directed DNA polymerase